MQRTDVKRKACFCRIFQTGLLISLRLCKLVFVLVRILPSPLQTRRKRRKHKAVVCCRELGANGVKSLLAVPVSFVSEHIETLEEIDMEYRELAHESGIQNWGRVPALNTNPVFIDDLAEAVLEALPYVGLMAGSNPSDAMVPLGMTIPSLTHSFTHSLTHSLTHTHTHTETAGTIKHKFVLLRAQVIAVKPFWSALKTG